MNLTMMPEPQHNREKNKIDELDLSNIKATATFINANILIRAEIKKLYQENL